MEIEDGYVDGIYNYCDRWCERCAYSRWCRLFADGAEREAALDPNMKALLDAAPLPGDIPAPPSREVQELIDELNTSAAQAAHEEPSPVRPEFDRHNHPLAARALSYCEKVHRWLRANDVEERSDVADPSSVISWYSTFVP